MLTYQTAYLKAHYPTHFYAAVLSNEITNTGKVARYVNEMKVFNIELLPPDVNSSNEGFTPVGDAIRFGLAAIKGLGSSAVQMIVQARDGGGDFRSIFDFAERVDQRSVNKRVLESLIKAGAFDSMSPNRSALMAVLDRAIEYGANAQKDRDSGQAGLFASVNDSYDGFVDEPKLPDIKQWNRNEQLGFEKEILGFYVSGHPLEEYASSIRSLTKVDSGNVTELEHGTQVAMGGMVVDIAIKTTKKGDRFSLFRLEDQFGSVKVVCWPEQYNRYKSLIGTDMAVLVKGRLELSDEGAATIITQEIQQLESARAKAVKTIIVKVTESSVNAYNLQALREIINSNPGNTTILIDLIISDNIVVRLRANQHLRLNVTPDLTEKIEQISPFWKLDFNCND